MLKLCEDIPKAYKPSFSSDLEILVSGLPPNIPKNNPPSLLSDPILDKTPCFSQYSGEMINQRKDFKKNELWPLHPFQSQHSHGDKPWGSACPQVRFYNSFPCLTNCHRFFSRLLPLFIDHTGRFVVRGRRREKPFSLARQGKGCISGYILLEVKLWFD